MSERDYFLAFINIVPIIVIWMRLESRMSRLEGRFDMFLSMIAKNGISNTNGH